MSHRDPHELIRIAVEQGWRKETRSSGHIMLFNPTTKRTVTVGNPEHFGDPRAVLNFRSELIRAGLFLRKEETEREEKPPLPEPKLVVDRNPGAYAPKREEKKMSGVSASNLIRDYLLGRETVTHMSQIVEVVLAKKTCSKQNIYSTVSSMVRKGLVLNPHKDEYYWNRGVVKVAPEEPQVMEDQQVLNNALAALADLEKLVKKYQGVVDQLSAVKKLLG